MGDLTIPSQPEERLPELILPQPLLTQLERVLLEYRQRAKLMAHGMSPRRKSLLAGPPGTGKTMTACVLAGELHLPFYTVFMDKLVTKYMGETSAKLRQIFACMVQHRVFICLMSLTPSGGSARVIMTWAKCAEY